MMNGMKYSKIGLVIAILSREKMKLNISVKPFPKIKILKRERVEGQRVSESRSANGFLILKH